MMPVLHGYYRHYSGREYRVEGFARHSETHEDMVIYQALYDDHQVWVRPAWMFVETVEKDGATVPRFMFLGMRRD